MKIFLLYIWMSKHLFSGKVSLNTSTSNTSRCYTGKTALKLDWRKILIWLFCCRDYASCTTRQLQPDSGPQLLWQNLTDWGKRSSKWVKWELCLWAWADTKPQWFTPTPCACSHSPSMSVPGQTQLQQPCACHQSLLHFIPKAFHKLCPSDLCGQYMWRRFFFFLSYWYGNS